MNRIELRPTAALRIRALIAAAIVTGATLSGIDALAGREASTMVAAATSSGARS